MFCIFSSKSGDSSWNVWWVIVRTSKSWQIHTHTDTGDDNTRRPKGPRVTSRLVMDIILLYAVWCLCDIIIHQKPTKMLYTAKNFPSTGSSLNSWYADFRDLAIMLCPEPTFKSWHTYLKSVAVYAFHTFTMYPWMPVFVGVYSTTDIELS